MKKRIIRFTALFAFIIAVFQGCDLLEDCGTCEYVLYSNGVEVERGVPMPYCGDDYYNKLNDPGRYAGDNWAIWECY
ncbi:MAG TPA: hypothetical protein ENN61_06695 [Bacteroidaceae bacterium]|nr:hypothetical protein [Bacteroidaceae bacterium]